MNNTSMFEWKFKKNWHTDTFLGRRWTELMDGEYEVPSNGCVFWWASVLSTFFWLMRATVLFPVRKMINPIGKFIKTIEQLEKEAEAKRKARALSQHKRFELKTPWLIKKIGQGFHFIFAGKYSPFKFIVTRAINALEAIGGFVDKNPIVETIIMSFVLGFAAFGIISITIYLLCLLIFAPWFISVLIAFGFGIGAGIVFLLITLLIRSEFGLIIGRMIMNGKNKVCPGIVVED